MKILLMTTHLNAGGITSYLFSLSKGLVRSGHDVFILSSPGNREKDFCQLGVNLLLLNIWTKSEASPKIYSNLPRVLKFLQNNQIDVLHAQTRVTQVMGRLLEKLSGVPLVSTCHGFFRPKFFRKVCPCWGRRVIAISPAVQKHLINDFNVPSSQTVFVPNGIDLQMFSYVTDEIRENRKRILGLSGFKVIGIIARLSEVKGHDVLLNAMPVVIAKNPQVKLIVVGEGKIESELRDQAERLGITHYVLFEPAVNRTAEYLQAVDIFVMPSRQEGLGLSVLEAQACGLPVIASRVGGLPSIIENGKTGILVPVGDSKSLSLAIEGLLKNEAQALEIGRLAREFVLNNFSMEGMAEKTLAVYDQVIQCK